MTGAETGMVLSSSVKIGGSVLIEVVKQVFRWNDEQIEKAGSDWLREAVSELVRQFDAFREYYFCTRADALGQHNRKLDEDSALRLFPKLFPEAVESTTRERMRLLCAALAGAMNPDVDAETKSRVARVIVQLEPSDIILLKRHHDQFGTTTLRGAISDSELSRETSSRQALALAGCIDVDPEGMSAVGIRITKLGRDVLAHLAAWKPKDDSEGQGG